MKTTHVSHSPRVVSLPQESAAKPPRGVLWSNRDARSECTYRQVTRASRYVIAQSTRMKTTHVSHSPRVVSLPQESAAKPPRGVLWSNRDARSECTYRQVTWASRYVIAQSTRMKTTHVSHSPRVVSLPQESAAKQQYVTVWPWFSSYC